MSYAFLSLIPHTVVRREKNLRIVRVGSQSDAAKFAHGCAQCGLVTKFKLGRSKRYWYVRVVKPEVRA